MPRYIRYLENGEYKYASVKPVGDISKLKINAPDLVSAINSLIDGGVLDLVGDRFDEVDKKIDDVGLVVSEHAQTIITQHELYVALQQKADDVALEQDRILADQAIIIEEAKKTKAELQAKLDSTQYQEQYATLVEEMQRKANSIDVQGIVDSVNQDIVEQTNEINNAKTEILNAQLKATELNAKVDQHKSEFIEQVTATKELARTNLETAKSELNTTINGVQVQATQIQGNLDQAKQDLTSKINADISDTNLKVTAVDNKVDQTVTNLTSKINTDVATVNGAVDDLEARVDQSAIDLGNTQTSLTKAQQDLLATQNLLNGTKQELDSVKNNIVYKVEIFSTNGGVFKNGNSNTTLEARVYHGMKDVTDTINASKFRWTRVSVDRAGDDIWNANNIGGKKSVAITPVDIKGRATFNCEILE